MTAFYFKGVPDYYLNSFVAVRDSLDNLTNLMNLAEVLNACGHCKIDSFDDSFDFVLFSGEFSRALVRKKDGFFSMAIPFQIVNDGCKIQFCYDFLGEEVSGVVVSIIKNCIATIKNSGFSHEDLVMSISENFSVSISDAILYCDGVITLLADDHGYLRFDDDPQNANGHFHPRYHFDFFYKNTSAIKIGTEALVDIECFYSLFDRSRPKRYLRE